MSIRLHLKLLLHKNECNHAKRSFYILLSNFLKILKKLILKKCIISIMTLRGKRGKTMKQKLTFKENLFIGSMLLVCSLEQET